jgi:hypothetical protein
MPSLGQSASTSVTVMDSDLKFYRNNEEGNMAWVRIRAHQEWGFALDQEVEEAMEKEGITL